MRMTDLEQEMLALVLEQTITIRNLKIKIRMINPEGEFYPPEDWKDCSEIVEQAIQLLNETSKETK